MKKRSHTLILLVLTSLVLWSDKALSYEVDPVTYLKLPKSCQSWFILAPSINLSWQITGMSFAGMKPPMDIRSAIGSNVAFMNHYCPSLVALIKLKDLKENSLTQGERRRRLSKIVREFDYQLNRHWSESNQWFKAEVLRNKAHALALLGKRPDAVTAYESAIKAYRAYLPAYWELASVFEESRNYEEAINTLRSALKEARSPNYKTEISDRIERLRKLVTDEETLEGSTDPTNIKSLAPAENTATQKRSAR